MTDTRLSSGSAADLSTQLIEAAQRPVCDIYSATLLLHASQMIDRLTNAAQAQRDPFDICKMIVEEECYLDLKPPKYTVGFAIRDRINAAQRETSPLPSTQNSPPVQFASHLSGERLPSSDAAGAGGEAVPSTPRGGEA